MIDDLLGEHRVCAVPQRQDAQRRRARADHGRQHDLAFEEAAGGGQRDISPKPFKPTPPFKYISDGSGRDSYVIKNSGGLVSEFRGGRSDAIFLSTLRDSIKSNVRASTETWRGPEITDYLNWTTPKVQAMQK